MQEEFLTMLRCPVSGTRLQLADSQLLERLNELVRRGELKNVSGQTVDEPLEAALVNELATVAYPVWDDIPDLVAEDGVPLDQLADAGADRSSSGEGPASGE